MTRRSLVDGSWAPEQQAWFAFTRRMIAILKLEWVLRSRYGYSQKAIADAMEKLAILENAVVGE